MRCRIITFLIAMIIVHREAVADAIGELPDRILSQCGLVSGLLVAAVIWLAVQLAKTRAAWETDRQGMKDVIEDLNTSYNNLAVSHAKQEGILLALRTSGGE